MKRLLFFLIILMVNTGFSQEIQNTISGTITDGVEPLTNVNIKILGTNVGTKTDTSGKYSITTSVGETLEYSYVGYMSIQIIVEDVTSELNVEMNAKARQLDEVVVKKQRRKTYNEKLLEYEANPGIIKTAYGFLDKRKSGTSLNIIDETEFFPGLTFIDAIQGKFNGRVTYPTGSRFTGAVIYLRERPNLLTGPQPAIYDIDGNITGDADAALSIPVSEIKRIAILRGLSAVTRYGTRANGGVIVINTKTARIKPKTEGIEVRDLQAAHESFIAENFCTPLAAIPQPYQLKNLMAAETEAEAATIFDEEKAFFTNSPYVLLDAGAYFNGQWNNRDKAKEIWDAVKVKYDDNTNILKAVAYHFEQQGNFKAALDIYQKISALRPEYAQTYRDLANIHQKLNNPKQALKLYATYLEKGKNDKKEIDAEGILFIMNVEALNILSKNKMKISKDFKDYEFPFQDAATRIVLEWNNGETEFDLEMIHDDKSYVVWNHSYVANPDEIKEEKVLGYSTQQFFVNKDDIGKWKFNIKYLGNKSIEPSYLKTTIQYNYGTASQKDVVKVIRLSEKESCLSLASI